MSVNKRKGRSRQESAGETPCGGPQSAPWGWKLSGGGVRSGQTEAEDGG